MNERKGSGGTPDDEQFVQQAKALFDDSVTGLDAQTLSRLNRSRQVALAELQRGPHANFAISHWVPAAGVAAAAVFAFVLWSADSTMDPAIAPATVTDFELLLTEDSFEMFEDLEFYAWVELETEAENGQESDGDVG